MLIGNKVLTKKSMELPAEKVIPKITNINMYVSDARKVIIDNI